LKARASTAQAASLKLPRGWPGRVVIAFEQALIGGADRGSYGDEADISTASATNDFRRPDVGLFSQRGRERNIRYHATDALRRDVATAIHAATNRAAT
jgi:hypothetical protein